MEGYTIKPRGGLLSIGPSSPEFGICGKASRAGLGLGPNDPGLDCNKSRETKRYEISSWCRWRNSMGSMLVLPSDRVEITINPVMMCSLFWPSDPGWITLKVDFY